MDQKLLSVACQLYGTSPELLIPLSGGFSNAVYQFSQGTHDSILRIGVEDCPPEQTLAMLRWVDFLSQEGAPVTRPLPSVNGRLLETLQFEGKRYTLTAFERATGILAERVPPEEWTDALFCSIGKAVGTFHRISRKYLPSGDLPTRPHWFDSYEVKEAFSLLAQSADPGFEKLSSLVGEIKRLPTSAQDYGLIHDDLHFANFLILPGGQVAIIDFDDCVYGWFAMDIAMALFDVLVLYHPGSEEQSRQFARRFLDSYLVGYRQENDISPFWIKQIPHFLKLKELCVYASLINHQAIDEPGGWVGRFMVGRRKRIADGTPYVDLDLESFVNGFMEISHR